MNIEIGTPEDIASLEQEIPEFEEPYSLEEITGRIDGKKHYCLVAYMDRKHAGYKLGYEQAPGKFYSWTGGILPAYRKRGIADALLNMQEDWCWKNAYKRIDVTSLNRHKAMIIFLLKRGYDIIGTDITGSIMLRKTSPNKALQPPQSR
jgi:GNAT superfamily N-acetyltransferase